MTSVSSMVSALAIASGCGRVAVALPDAERDDGCLEATYYADVDGDGHGDPAAAVAACEQPAATVTIGDDCDDRDAQRAPGLVESCDDLDDDCDPATVEVCPAGCVARRTPEGDHVYLACDAPQKWTGARAACTAAGYGLVQIDSAAENAFVRAFATEVLGAVDVHLGANDLVTEGTFVWDGGDPFWSGGPNGAPTDGRYASWDAGEPNNDGGENCARMLGNAQWDDNECGRVLRFVCRR